MEEAYLWGGGKGWDHKGEDEKEGKREQAWKGDPSQTDRCN